MAVYEIPLQPRPQRFGVVLAGTLYGFRLHYANADGGGWLLDIADATGDPLVCGIPLVTGADLLAQYPDLAIPGRLFVRSDGDPGAVPTFADLGISAHLYFIPT